MILECTAHLRAEQYHSTPETQTDESYIHPEDIEHFSHHDDIERQEYEREARYQGVSVDEAARAHDEPPVHSPSEAHQQEPMDANQAAAAPKPKIVRGVPPERLDPSVRYQSIGKDSAGQSEWGTGEQGYKQPKSPAERLRWASALQNHSPATLILYLFQEKCALQGKHQHLSLWYTREITHGKDRVQYKFRRSWGDF